MNSSKCLFRRLVIILLIVTTLAAAGCSLVGLGIGTVIDNRKPDYGLITGWSYSQVHAGELISVQCRDGNVLRGKFLGIKLLNASEYALQLEASARRSGLSVPYPGERVIVRFQSGQDAEADFYGLDYLSPGKGLSPVVRLRFLDSDTVQNLQPSTIREIASPSGTVISGSEIAHGLARGALPNQTALVVDTGAVHVVTLSAKDFIADGMNVCGTRLDKIKILRVRTASDSVIVFDSEGARLTTTSAAVRGRTTDHHLYLGLIDEIKSLEIEVSGYAVTPAAIPLSTIENIEIRNSKHGAVTGFLVGLGIDVTMMTIAVAVASSFGSSGGGFMSNGGGSFSCPFVYSFDGEQYVREAEVFGGAIFEKARRTDYACLDAAVPVNGQYRVKISNELEEIQYVDQLKLLAVDHEPGIQVCPDDAGRLLTLRDQVRPVSATSLSGSNVLNLVQANDELSWCGNPFNCDASSVSQLRDGVVAEFIRPRDADSVTLLLNLQNTQWSARTLYDVLSLYGADLQVAYDTLNNSESARNFLHQAAVREGALRVAVWDGSHWQEAGYVWEVGPTVARNRALRLAVDRGAGDRLRVKFESSVGFWIINSIVADFSDPAAVSVSEIPFESAINQNSRSIKSALMADDGEYYVMPSTNDWAELSFAAPQQPRGTARTIVLQATGYYTIKMPELGPGQPQLVAAILARPTELAAFAVRRLQETRIAGEPSTDLVHDSK